ncbi:MarR family winged helix-turn-helix transcriptional regulator [uncultured Methanobacterium sp.]|uniref:MarR family winged helix-turn-helix transcriptional regulator n=1 Tax=uncultured Methanobacterium sp. TaxID=176306 RepID=UPI002AA7AF19|nr:MarR family winged helix-turn-helix transcriptional regulator [uncultured Methanobacterium sp.]
MNEQVTEAAEYWDVINRIIHLKHHETARKHGLTLEQFHLLLKLDNLELIGLKNDTAPTIGEMASKLGNAPHTLSEKIKRLEKRGFVDKIRDKDDQRINRVMLTANGHQMVQDIRTESRDIFFYHALEKLDEKSLDCMVNSFKEIIQELSRDD